MAIRPVASLYTVLLELRIVPIPSTELQTLRQQGSVSPDHWLCPFYPGPDGVTAHIAHDRAGLFREVHLVAPELGRMRDDRPWIFLLRLEHGRLPPATIGHVSQGQNALTGVTTHAA
jgi:hypothetical protein